MNDDTESMTDMVSLYVEDTILWTHVTSADWVSLSVHQLMLEKEQPCNALQLRQFINQIRKC